MPQRVAVTGWFPGAQVPPPEKIGFPKGVMTIDGKPQRPRRKLEAYSANGLTLHTAVEWEDPETGQLRTSCNCPQWCRLYNGVRRCGHTDLLERDPQAGDLVRPPVVEEQPKPVSETLRGLSLS